MAVGMVRPDEAQIYVRRALDRFPDEPRFLLSRAIIADQRSRQRTAPGQPPADAEAVAEAYQVALSLAETADEARVRLAWLMHRARRSADALVLVDAIDEGRSPDRPMRYWRHLVRGQALESLNRLDDAAAAYRTALSLVPEAQSARVGLMNVLLQTGQRDEGLALAERIQTTPANAPDPWGSYWLADQRFFQSAMAQLRGIRR
jgi:tetratricopeptide (TPR) repeat protein